MNTSPSRETEPEILIIMVSYRTEALIVDHAARFSNGLAPTGVTLAIADNSPEPAVACREASAGSNHQLRYFHYPDNPLYLGAARHVLRDLAAESNSPLPYDAVVLCNADLHFDYGELVNTVRNARTHTSGWRWILAPKIVEAGRRYLPNPHVMNRPGTLDRRLALQWYPSWFLYRLLYQWRRRLSTNAHATAAPFTTMYSAYGAFVVFGRGFFSAGGAFHDGPLFGEEHGIAEQARVLEVPIFYTPELQVDHAAEASTSMRRVGARQRFEWQKTSHDFYTSWDVSTGRDSMTSMFKPG